MEQNCVLDLKIVLSLNSVWQAVGLLTVRKAVEDCMSESVHGDAPKDALDLEFEPDGATLSAPPLPVPWADWVELPVRPGDLFIRAPHRLIRAPTVVICRNYHKMPSRAPRLNSTAIFERDKYTCQYCGRVFPRKMLNLDHVIPQDPKYGGRTTWTNVVCSCITCNTKKANRLPGEAGMRLLRRPTAPKATPVVFDFREPKHPSWRPFLHA